MFFFFLKTEKDTTNSEPCEDLLLNTGATWMKVTRTFPHISGAPRNDTSPESFLCTLPRLHLFPKSRVFGPKTARSPLYPLRPAAQERRREQVRGGRPTSRGPPRPGRPRTHPVRVQVHLQPFPRRAQVGPLPHRRAAHAAPRGALHPRAGGAIGQRRAHVQVQGGRWGARPRG